MKYYNIVNNEMELTDKGKEALNRLGITLEELKNYPDKKLSVDYWKGCKTYLDQALKNGHGCTWLDDSRIPFTQGETPETVTKKPSILKKNAISYIRQDEPLYGGTGHSKGRFPANVLCEDGMPNDGIKRKSGGREGKRNITWGDSFINTNKPPSIVTPCTKDEGSFSRYFSLDAWFAERIKLLPKEAQKTFPWLIVPKASKAEKYRNLDIMPELSKRPSGIAYNEHSSILSERERNIHPTIKPLKLMMWLIILGTQEGDTVLDPFMGSGTTPIAAKATHRIYKGIEREKEFYDIAIKRIDEIQKTIGSFL
jgi:site-specific DNA-methyltransferase (adenine-specific)